MLSQSYNVGFEVAQSTSLLQGYENMPLVSLDKATATLENIIPDIALMVSTAKLNCSNPDDDLTCDESASIMLYTIEWTPKESSFCFVLDEAMRRNDKQQLKVWFLYLKLMFHALSKLKSKRCTVFREVRTDLSGQYTKGCKFVSTEFSVCATTVKTITDDQRFSNTDVRTLLTIDCATGKDISKHSFRHTNDEILLMPGRRYDVVSCLNPTNQLHIIQIQESVL